MCWAGAHLAEQLEVLRRGAADATGQLLQREPVVVDRFVVQRVCNRGGGVALRCGRQLTGGGIGTRRQRERRRWQRRRRRWDAGVRRSRDTIHCLRDTSHISR